MSEHLRALVIILVLAAVVFKLAERPLCAAAIALRDYRRRRNLWFAVTLIAFFSHSFWLYVLVAGALVFHYGRKERNPFALYCMLLFAVPPFNAPLPTLGLVGQLFDVSHLQLLSVTLLLPAALRLAQTPREQASAGRVTDWLVGAYLVLILILTAGDPRLSFTVVLRTAVTQVLDVVLCYYVASRALINRESLREALATFLLAGVMMATVSMFEFVKGWLLYSSLDESMGLTWGYGSYLSRGADNIRAVGSAGHAIVMGYVMAICLGLLVYLRLFVRPVGMWRLAALAVFGALACSLSRGPWVGAAVGILLGVAMGPNAGPRILRFVGASIVIGIVLMLTPMGPKILSYLPFIGDVNNETVSYRQELFRISMLVIRQNPWFGTFDAMANPLMEQLRQGEGIIDLVNTYIAVALSYGVVGLAFFAGAFFSAAFGVWQVHRRLGPRDDAESEHLARALLAILATITITIVTVSPICAIPPVYWSFIGIAVAYARWQRTTAKNAIAARPVRGPAYGMRPTR